MLRSMYSAISGLKNFQNKLDVIGNNISNVNTYGYKKGRITFSDLVSQQLKGAGAPTVTRGGTNPQQIGSGSQIASIDTIDTQGSTQSTGRGLDMEINGDGYFMVKDGAETKYTRAGNFYMDNNGDLVNADGMNVLGHPVKANGAIDTTVVKKLGISDSRVKQPTTSWFDMVGNLDFNALTNGTNKTSPQNFKIYDSNGTQHDAQITFTGNSSNVSTDKNGQDFLKTINFTVSSPDSSTGNQTGTVSFNPDGSVDSVTANNGSLDFSFGGNNATANITAKEIDFSGLTSYDAPVTSKVINDTTSLDSYSIDSAGQITGVLSNGDLQMLGQITLSKFDNPGGLTKSGSNLFSASGNSGNPVVTAAGENGAGDIQAGALEMSNVDLSEEFTSMIEAQRGFQANARVITTADQVLQELVDLKR